MSTNSTHPIRTGLAGFGLSGQVFQAPFISADDRFELRKIYERSSDRAKEAYPDAQIVRSFDELLTDDIDLVIISTPVACHVPMARQALEAGKHVVVEKPAAVSSAEVEELCQLAKEKGVIFTVYQNRRLDGDFRTVQKLISEGTLGEIVDYESRFDRFVQGASAKPWKRAGGDGSDVLYDLGIHLLDQAYALFGMPEEVYADLRKEREESGGTDNIGVILYYPDKKVVLSASEIAALPGPRFAVQGRRGSYLKYGTDPQEPSLRAGARPVDAGFGEDDEEAYGTLRIVSDAGMETQKLPTERGDYGAYYDNLYRAIREDGDLLVPPEQAAEVLKILEAAKKSQEEGRRIRL